ncbi:MAG: PQQ-dependent sugar dehydrogenase [Rubrobacter sp.]|nr:PQQ-dependent sugar dehydrogenase [Rubrobacter sp.]
MFVLALLLLCVACGPSTGGSGSEESGGDLPTISAGDNGNGGETTSSPETTTETTQEPERATRVEATVLASNLEVPWSFAFLPNGGALVTERDAGRLLRVGASGDVREIQTLPEQGVGEGGLLGVTVSPNYERDRWIYAYYTTQRDNRVVRFQIGERPEPILTGIPVNSYHDGGRIKFGPDGMLYVTTGDAGDTSNSQDRSSLGGKILRLAPDGSIPEDNPFPNSPVYSYGHRNVQGLAWDADGQLFASEFGENTWDEVNRIEPGGNYGWPEYEGDGGSEAEADGFINPITQWPTSQASPSGAAILVDGSIPLWDGDLFVTALRGECLWHLELDESGNVVGREPLLKGDVGRIRDVTQAPDGSLWISTSNHDGRGAPSTSDDRIIRLGPASG